MMLSGPRVTKTGPKRPILTRIFFDLGFLLFPVAKPNSFKWTLAVVLCCKATGKTPPPPLPQKHTQSQTFCATLFVPQVYAALASTPYNGRKVAAAIALVMKEETKWVKWKVTGFNQTNTVSGKKAVVAGVADPTLKAPPAAPTFIKSEPLAVTGSETETGPLTAVDSQEDLAGANLVSDSLSSVTHIFPTIANIRQ